MKEALSKQLAYLNDKIQLNDFNTIERGLKNHLRFELGDTLENGTKKRVNQAVKRAVTLFENFITSSESLYIITYDFIEDVFAKTPNRLYEVLNNLSCEIYDEEIALRYFQDEEEIEKSDGKLGVFFGKRDEINYKSIFEGIANLEMGFSPTIHQLVYFFQPETKKWFFMYDDRGCLMFSEDKEYLRETFFSYENWLVESQKHEMVSFK